MNCASLLQDITARQCRYTTARIEKVYLYRSSDITGIQWAGDDPTSLSADFIFSKAAATAVTVDGATFSQDYDAETEKYSYSLELAIADINRQNQKSFLAAHDHEFVAAVKIEGDDGWLLLGYPDALTAADSASVADDGAGATLALTAASPNPVIWLSDGNFAAGRTYPRNLQPVWSEMRCLEEGDARLTGWKQALLLLAVDSAGNAIDREGRICREAGTPQAAYRHQDYAGEGAYDWLGVYGDMEDVEGCRTATYDLIVCNPELAGSMTCEPQSLSLHNWGGGSLTATVSPNAGAWSWAVVEAGEGIGFPLGEKAGVTGDTLTLSGEKGGSWGITLQNAVTRSECELGVTVNIIEVAPAQPEPGELVVTIPWSRSLAGSFSLEVEIGRVTYDDDHIYWILDGALEGERELRIIAQGVDEPLAITIDFGEIGAATPIWEMQDSVCTAGYGHGERLITYRDVNALSQTYGRERSYAVYDPYACPVWQPASWYEIGRVCSVGADGVATEVITYVDLNKYSETFNSLKQEKRMVDECGGEVTEYRYLFLMADEPHDMVPAAVVYIKYGRGAWDAGVMEVDGRRATINGFKAVGFEGDETPFDSPEADWGKIVFEKEIGEGATDSWTDLEMPDAVRRYGLYADITVEGEEEPSAELLNHVRAAFINRESDGRAPSGLNAVMLYTARKPDGGTGNGSYFVYLNNTTGERDITPGEVYPGLVEGEDACIGLSGEVEAWTPAAMLPDLRFIVNDGALVGLRCALEGYGSERQVIGQFKPDAVDLDADDLSSRRRFLTPCPYTTDGTATLYCEGLPVMRVDGSDGNTSAASWTERWLGDYVWKSARPNGTLLTAGLAMADTVFSGTYDPEAPGQQLGMHCNGSDAPLIKDEAGRNTWKGNASRWYPGGVTNLFNAFHSYPELKNSSLTSIHIPLAISAENTITDIRWAFSANENGGGELLRRIDGLRNLDVRGCTSLSHVFANRPALRDLSELRYWRTGSVTDFSGLFQGCKALVSSGTAVSGSLDLREWDMSAATYFEGMFDGCEAMTVLPWTAEGKPVGLASASAPTYKNMFRGCKALEQTETLSYLDLTGFDLARGNCEGMFEGCSWLGGIKLRSIGSPDNWVNTEGMFRGCTYLQRVWDGLTGIYCSVDFGDCGFRAYMFRIIGKYLQTPAVNPATGRREAVLTVNDRVMDEVEAGSDEVLAGYFEAARGRGWTIKRKD